MLDFVESQSLQSIDYDINEAPLPSTGVEKDLVNLDLHENKVFYKSRGNALALSHWSTRSA
jgi:hypothetical protein